MKRSRVRLIRRAQLMIVLLVVMSLLPLGTALADPSFVLDGFKTKWSRADKPVNDGNSSPARSWLWGPEGFNPPSGTTEPYGDSPGGVRTVEYFDKARMELNNPANGLVTNGLLVRELISGNLATSDAGSTKRRAADDIPVAGDPGGNNGPTYFSFQKIATLNNDNPSPDRTGQAVNDTLSKDGTVGNNPALGSNVKYVYYDSTLKHNIPDVFWTFMNQRGNVYLNGGLQANQPVLGDNPVAPWLDAMGLPITDAYWGQVTLAGQAKDVLIQAFERRVVTYTPSNPAAFQVEMGNVGRHYYTWRYTASYDLPVGPPPLSCDTLPASTGGAYPFLKCGPAGMVIRVVAPMGPSENVAITVTLPDGSKSTVFRTSQADGNTLLGWGSLRSEVGKYTFSYKGQVSGKEAETYVLLDKPVDKPTIIVFPDPARLDQDITVVAVGFTPGEQVLVGAVAPDPNAPFLYAVNTATQGGGVTIRIILRNVFTGNNAKYLQPGQYGIVATNGNQSNYAVKVITVTK